MADNPHPNWEKISQLYDDLDKALDVAIMERQTNTIEVGIALLMIEEKLSQEKHRLLSQYYRDENLHEEPKKTPPEDFYR